MMHVVSLDVGKLVSLMEEQISLLRRIDERQAASGMYCVLVE
jgi:hypothetical protein